MPTDAQAPPLEDVERTRDALHGWLRANQYTTKASPLAAKLELIQADFVSWPLTARIIREAFLTALDTWQQSAPGLNSSLKRDVAEFLVAWRLDSVYRQRALKALDRLDIKVLDESLERIAEFAVRSRALRGEPESEQRAAGEFWTGLRTEIGALAARLRANLRPRGARAVFTHRSWTAFKTKLQGDLSHQAKLSQGEIAKILRGSVDATDREVRQKDKDRIRRAIRRASRKT